MTMNKQLDMTRIPEHIAIIMDGNGRWAQQRGKERSYGHQAGVEAVKRITSESAKLGVKYLTLYTFSTENWSRPADEVAALMGLILTSLEDELFMKNNVRFRVIGDVSRMPESVVQKLRETEEHTANNTTMTLVVALSYSSKWEITKAMRDIATEVKQGTLSVDAIDDTTISQHLTTNFMPDPELLIRTGGELRISNFLLWQSAYSELYFTETLFPDFSLGEFRHAVKRYGGIRRKRGGVCAIHPISTSTC